MCNNVIGSAGTSSILAGALLAAIYRCTGRTYDTDSLIHGVLYLEQLLTTGNASVRLRHFCLKLFGSALWLYRTSFSSSGGGWQDQVGGLVGGIKVGRCKPSLPLRVEVEILSPPKGFLVSLEQHLLLVYTGKTRLARNLLQVCPVRCLSVH